MRSLMAASRGPQRALAITLVLALVAFGLHYWRLRSASVDLAVELDRLEGLLQRAEDKSSKIDHQRREASENLKKANAELQQVQMDQEEDNIRCKQLKENLAEAEESKSALMKQLEDDKDDQDRQMRDAATKLQALKAELTQLKEREERGRLQLDGRQAELTRTRAELESARQQLAQAGQASPPAAGERDCQARLAQAQAELGRCQAGTTRSTRPAEGDRRRWPGLVAPRGQLDQARLDSDFQPAAAP
ncbi:chromosome partition protein Smc-like [Pollicipes pollicipes]|uniref:chromosome partition protein Smc-like n=1 Tax=Pollicipes pollicipes TaxID=41117 RepID=UPI0018858C15|nr:chromosome partition protein Smc-like [Pollicipes pollicipes]